MTQSAPMNKNKSASRFLGMPLALALWCMPQTGMAAFEVDGKSVHPGCVMELTPAANGDLLAAEMVLATNMPNTKGCQVSNRYALNKVEHKEGRVSMKSGANAGSFSYKVMHEFGDGIFLLETTHNMGGTFSAQNYLLTMIKKRKIVGGAWADFEKYDVVKLKTLAYLLKKPTAEKLKTLTQSQILKATKDK